MRSRGVIAQLGVAAGALLLAAVTWLRPPEERRSGETPVLALRKGEVQAVRWDDGATRVEVVRAASETPGAWVRIGRSPSLAPPTLQDAGVPGPDARAGAAASRLDAGVARRSRTGSDGGVRVQRPLSLPAPDRELRGNDAALALLDALSPPRAVRALGAVSSERRDEMGLASPARTLQLDTPRGPARFGVASPPGASGTYLAGEDGRVWILADEPFAQLSSAASRLVDRRLHAFRAEEADTVSVQAGGRSRAFAVRRTGAAVRLVPADPPEVPDGAATAWAERVWRLAPAELLGRGEVPREGTPAPALRVDWLRNRRPLGFLEVARAGGETFARSEHTVGWVRLVPAPGLLDQAERLLPAQP